MPYLDRNSTSSAILCDLCGDTRWGDPFTDDDALDRRRADASGDWVWEPAGYSSRVRTCGECDGTLYPSWVYSHPLGDAERIRDEWVERMRGITRIRKIMATWLAGDLYKWEAYALIRETLDCNECLSLGNVSAVTDIPLEVLETRMRELEAMREFLNHDRMAVNSRMVVA